MKKNLKCLFFACFILLSYRSSAETILFKDPSRLYSFSSAIIQVESCLQQPFVNNDYCFSQCTANWQNSQQDCEILKNSFEPLMQSQNECMASIRYGHNTAYNNLMGASDNYVAPNQYCIQQALPGYSPPSLRMIY
jgi:hypothetical protein